MNEGQAFCTGCGKPRPIIGASSETPTEGLFAGQPIYSASPTVDPRYPIVACGRVKRPGTFDRAQANRIIRERRARRKAAKVERERVLRSATGDLRRAVGARVR